MGTPPQRNIQQHYVTAAYLVGFTPEGTRDSQLYVYERNTERRFRLIADEAAKRRNYYSAPLPQGGFDDTVDTMLTALEGQAMPSLQKILAGDYSLSTFERALLAFLIAFQEFRTPWTRQIFRQMQEDLTTSTMHMLANQPGVFERISAELRASGESDGSVTPDQMRDALRGGVPHRSSPPSISDKDAVFRSLCQGLMRPNAILIQSRLAIDL